MDRNLALEFVRVTEAAAIACAKWMGKGNKNAADQAAVDAMRSRFNAIDFSGEVVIGEGEKDEAPLLYIGEKIGTGKGPKIDIAVDPLEGTTPLAQGGINSISVLAAGPKGTLLNAPGTYMDQLCVGPEARGCIDIAAPVRKNLKNIAAALDKDVGEVTVVILDRPRHEQMIKDIREAGARIRLIDHGTVSAGIAVSQDESGIDVMMGIGGAPEGVITAAALKCIGGDMQAVLKPHNDKFSKQASSMGFDDIDKVFTIEDLAKGNELMFAATGVLDGALLKGVRFIASHKAVTYSLSMRASTGTVRYLETHHILRRD